MKKIFFSLCLLLSISTFAAIRNDLLVYRILLSKCSCPFTFMDMVMSPVNIALLNSVFRIATILILAPFISKIEKLVFFLIKDTDRDNEEQADFDLLRGTFYGLPTAGDQSEPDSC